MENGKRKMRIGKWKTENIVQKSENELVISRFLPNLVENDCGFEVQQISYIFVKKIN